MPQRPLEARDAVGAARPARARQPDAGLRASLRLRAPEPRDISALVELINAAYKPRDWWLFEQLRTSEEGFAQEMAKPGARGIVAEIDGRPVAHVALWLQDDGAWLVRLATAVEQQGRGIATVLVQEAERQACAGGYTELRLDCVLENGLPAYYESLGFGVEREEHGRMRNATTEWTRVYMRKELATSAVAARSADPPARARQPGAAFAARVSFRTGGGADVPAIVPMIIEAYRREAWLLPGPRMDEPRLCEELRDAGTTLIIAEIDGALAGCVRLKIREADAYFGLLAVAKHARGNGLASMLIARAEGEALARGRDVMHMDCAKELGLPPLYESLGYVAGDEEFGVRWGSVEPFTLVYMKKALR